MSNEVITEMEAAVSEVRCVVAARIGRLTNLLPLEVAEDTRAEIEQEIRLLKKWLEASNAAS